MKSFKLSKWVTAQIVIKVKIGKPELKLNVPRYVFHKYFKRIMNIKHYEIILSKS